MLPATIRSPIKTQGFLYYIKSQFKQKTNMKKVLVTVLTQYLNPIQGTHILASAIRLSENEEHLNGLLSDLTMDNIEIICPEGDIEGYKPTHVSFNEKLFENVDGESSIILTSMVLRFENVDGDMINKELYFSHSAEKNIPQYIDNKKPLTQKTLKEHKRFAFASKENVMCKIGLNNWFYNDHCKVTADCFSENDLE